MNNTSIVILNYNDWHTVSDLVNIVHDFDSIDHIILVDNCSNDDSYEQLHKLEDKKVICIKTDKNGGYGYGNNYGVKYASDAYHSEFVIIANPDVIFDNDTIKCMKDEMSFNKECGIITAIQLDINNQIIPSFAWKKHTTMQLIFGAGYLLDRFFKNFYSVELIEKERCNTNSIEVECVPGAFLMARTDSFLEIGGYDEDNFLFWEEEMIACKMESHKYTTRIMLNKRYIHNHSVSINKNIPNAISRTKLLLKSRYYYLKNYRNNNFLCLLIARIMYKICVFERIIVLILKGR